MKAGDEITVEAGELVAGGAAIARVDGFPIFAENLFPGDVARVRLFEVKKGFARAELVSIEKPSALRRAEPCPVANECGGCDWTALRLDAQLAAKERILTESLRRIGKFDVAALPPIAVHASPLNYRLRSRLHRQGDAVGFYAMRSNRVVPLAKECEVVGVETARAFGTSNGLDVAGDVDVADRDVDLDVIPTVREGPVRVGGAKDALRAPHSPRSLPHGRDDSNNETGSASDYDINTNGNYDIDIWEIDRNLITAERELTIRVDRFTYRLSTEAFFQVNRHLLGTMLRLVGAHAAQSQARHQAIDLYAGVGFFTLPLTEHFHRVIAVEGSPVSHRYAKQNVPRNVKLVRMPVESWPMPRADFIFLDPPRAGARREVIDAVAKNAGERICYLSCDPVTFSRDAARLTASGWRLSTLDLLDLFPNTHHVETLSSFERAG
jgi:23S rRNA (uracil1939-C5)-methyltransferase